jgi:hypothetical protein
MVAWAVVICVLFIGAGMASVWLGAGVIPELDLFGSHIRLQSVGITIIFCGLTGMVIALGTFLR